MRKGNLWLCALAMMASPALAQSDNGLDARRAAVEELYVAQGHEKVVAALIQTFADSTITSVQKAHPEIPPDRLDVFRANIVANLNATKDRYMAQQKDLLSERLSLDDLRACIAFYKTLTGQRLADIAPALIPDAGKNQTAWTGPAIAKAWQDLNQKAAQ